MTDAEALERCDREIAEILSRTDIDSCPAWLVALGVNDWDVEKIIILSGASRLHPTVLSDTTEIITTKKGDAAKA